MLPALLNDFENPKIGSVDGLARSINMVCGGFSFSKMAIVSNIVDQYSPEMNGVQYFENEFEQTRVTGLQLRIENFDYVREVMPPVCL